MALNKEQILTLTCLKEVGIKGVGPQKILAIGTFLASNNISLPDYVALAKVMAGMKEKAINKVTAMDLEAAAEIAQRIISASTSNGIGLTGYYDDGFPAMLRNTINEEGKLEPPLLLWYRGDLSVTKMPGIAVIGTREPTPEGVKGGEFLSGEFAKRGFNIVSGLALGCDTSGHFGALMVNGKTTAILGNGLDHNSIYPAENQDLAEEIVAKGGLLLSEYHMGMTVNRYSLVARDRLQAGLSLATLVVQTGIKGGTMHAANTTLKSRKPLYTMYYKNPETNNDEKCLGNALLVEKGATYIKGGDDIDAIAEHIKTQSENKETLF